MTSIEQPSLLPLRGDDKQDLEANRRELLDWIRRLRAYIAALEARIAALEAGP